MEKRALFRSRWLPYALVAPQLAVSVVFFFWPAGQTLYWSTLLQDAFAAHPQFVWLDNFKALLSDETYFASFKVTALFSDLPASPRAWKSAFTSGRPGCPTRWCCRRSP